MCACTQLPVKTRIPFLVLSTPFRPSSGRATTVHAGASADPCPCAVRILRTPLRASAVPTHAQQTHACRLTRPNPMLLLHMRTQTAIPLEKDATCAMHADGMVYADTCSDHSAPFPLGNPDAGCPLRPHPPQPPRHSHTHPLLARFTHPPYIHLFCTRQSKHTKPDPTSPQRQKHK